MAKKKLGYWQERYLKDKAANVNTSERYINSRLKKYYTEAAKEIEADINKFYEKYAKEEKITLAEARKRLKEADFQDVDFEKMSKETAALKRKYKNVEAPEAVKKQIEEQERKLNLLSKKGQVSRLEALHASIDQATLKLYDKTQMTVYDLLKDGYQDGYYKNIYRIQQAVGYGVDFTAVNEAAVKKAVLSKHGKKNFSSTLYQHRKDLSRDLQENLTIGMIRGESVQQMSKRISKRMGVSYSNAKRLVRTETAYVYEQATLDSYIETGVTRYEFLATLDNRTSEICQSLDGKEFNVEDAMPGENFPPMHPNCRSTTVAVFDDDVVTTRAARDSEGKYYKVPSDMTYPDWKKEHITSPQIEPIRGSQLNSYSDKEISEMADRSSKILSKYEIAKENKWSGKMALNSPEASYGKLWNCNIATLNMTEQSIIMHEMLHAHSASHYPAELYSLHADTEEAAVQYMNLMVCGNEQIYYVESAYEENVEILRKIYHSCDGRQDEFDFALELFNIDMPDRKDWLTEKINSAILNLDDMNKMDSYMELLDAVEQMDNGW